MSSADSSDYTSTDTRAYERETGREAERLPLVPLAICATCRHPRRLFDLRIFCPCCLRAHAPVTVPENEPYPEGYRDLGFMGDS